MSTPIKHQAGRSVGKAGVRVGVVQKKPALSDRAPNATAINAESPSKGASRSSASAKSHISSSGASASPSTDKLDNDVFKFHIDDENDYLTDNVEPVVELEYALASDIPEKQLDHVATTFPPLPAHHAIVVGQFKRHVPPPTPPIVRASTENEIDIMLSNPSPAATSTTKTSRTARTSATVTSKSASAVNAIDHSFPFQIESCARKWFHVISRDDFVDFQSTEDVIIHQHGVLSGILREGKEQFTPERLEEVYKKSRADTLRVLTAAADEVSRTLQQPAATILANREAYKEYADVNRKALVFLIERANHLLARFDEELPNMTKGNRSTTAAVVTGSQWPIEQMSIINKFVQISQEPEWVSMSIASSAPGSMQASVIPGRHDYALFILDIDHVQRATTLLLMSIGFIVSCNASQYSVQFAVRTVGIAQPALTALLLTFAWPVYAFLLIGVVKRPRAPFTWRFIVRAVLFGGLEASAAIFTAISIHSLPLSSYQIMKISSHVLFSGIARTLPPPLRLVAMGAALISLFLIFINFSTGSTLLLYIVTATIASALSVIHLAVIRSRTEAENADASTAFIEASAISGFVACMGITIVLIASGNATTIATSISNIPTSLLPAFFAAALLIAFQNPATAFLEEQLSLNGNSHLPTALTVVSGIAVIACGFAFLNDDVTLLLGAATVCACASSAIDACAEHARIGEEVQTDGAQCAV